MHHEEENNQEERIHNWYSAIYFVIQTRANRNSADD